MMDDQITLGEVGRRLTELQRTVDNIDCKLDAARDEIGHHETAIALLRQTRAFGQWTINGLFAIALMIGEWLLHRK